ncbi:hypothetical protein HY620_00465 [Candidatus Uhrbacteria bacterium]|nr:hypothetical protein [Candidatus Uhrbacteria bacterium]
MKFDYKHSGVEKSEIEKTAKKLQPYITKLQGVVKRGGYASPESSINCVSDDETVENVIRLAKKKKFSKVTHIVVVGIGGSNLGTKAIYDALYGQFDVLEPQRLPKMIFLDTCSMSLLGHFEYFVKKHITRPEECLFVLITKSGTTTESIVNADIGFAALTKKFGIKIAERMVVVTDTDSALWKYAFKEEIDILAIPRMVGGRYSVFSSVGLLPLAALGVPIESMLSAATHMRDVCLQPTSLKNPALLSASILYAHVKKGRSIHDTFLFAPELESLGKWYRQLLAESLGKEKNREGKTVQAGLTPTVSIGTTDLHSMAQLYLGGSDERITTFVSREKDISEELAPQSSLAALVPGIRGTHVGTINEAILKGTQKAYQKKKRPYMDVVLKNISPESIAEWMQWKMMEVMFLGYLIDVNAFDQPEVEIYKQETRKVLNAKRS